MPSLTGYDPWAHAERLGVNVIYRPLQRSKGVWIPSQRLIAISPGLRSFVEVSVLAHEVVHAEYNDPPGWHARFERRANRVAAKRLIDEPRMVDLLRGTRDYDSVCIELGVTRELLLARLSG